MIDQHAIAVALSACVGTLMMAIFFATSCIDVIEGHKRDREQQQQLQEEEEEEEKEGGVTQLHKPPVSPQQAQTEEWLKEQKYS